MKYKNTKPEINKKDRQYNGQKKKNKRTNNNLQSNTQQKTNNRGTPLKAGGELRCSGFTKHPFTEILNPPNSQCVIHIFIIEMFTVQK